MSQQIHRGKLGLYPFRNQLKIEGLSEPDNRADDRQIARAGA
jgi:hypothetical protein